MIDDPIQLSTPEQVQRSIADRLRAWRLHLNWKQDTLADRSGVSVPTIRRFEKTGQTTVENLLKLCFALGKLDEFAGVLEPPDAQSMKELESIADDRISRQRGTQ